MDDKALFRRYQQLEHVEQDCNQLKSTFPYLARCRYVAPEGPDTAVDAFVVLDMPSATDEMQRRAYAGQVGLITRQLLRIGGLEPARCWLTYAIKYRLPRGRRAKLTEMKAFRKPLQDEWHAVGQPKLLIPVGLAALGTITGELPDEAIIGNTAMKYGPLTLAPMRHPRAGFGNPEAQDLIEREWESLKEWRDNGSP